MQSSAPRLVSAPSARPLDAVADRTRRTGTAGGADIIDVDVLWEEGEAAPSADIRTRAVGVQPLRLHPHDAIVAYSSGTWQQLRVHAVDLLV